MKLLLIAMALITLSCTKQKLPPPLVLTVHDTIIIPPMLPDHDDVVAVKETP
jgi:hypothetical protein